MPQYDLAGNPLPEESSAPAQYDLAGNPIAPQPGAPYSPPAGYVSYPQPGQPARSGYMPTSADQLFSRRSSEDLANLILQNTSGTMSDVPAEVRKMRWNWGGFLLPTFWGFNHGFKWLAITLWAVGAVLNLVSQVPAAWSDVLGGLFTAACMCVSVFFGLFGNSIAWKMRRFEHGLDEFKEVQRYWMWAGFAVLIASMVLGGKLIPGVTIIDLGASNKFENLYRPVNYDITDYQIMYGHRPPLL